MDDIYLEKYIKYKNKYLKQNAGSFRGIQYIKTTNNEIEEIKKK